MSSVFDVLDALSTVLEVVQRYLMCTKHQLGDNLGDDSPAHYLLTLPFCETGFEGTWPCLTGSGRPHTFKIRKVRFLGHPVKIVHGR